MSFPATYPGTCPAADCGETIEVDDRLAMTDDGYAVHEACHDDAPEKPLGPVCPRCFTEKAVNGSCGCDD